MKSKPKRFIYLAMILGIFLAAIEIALRQWGFPPYSSSWVQRIVDLHVDPPGSLFQPHPILGFTHVPGTQHVRLAKTRWTQTHGVDCLRTMTEEKHSTKDIWIFGCSFTHGLGVNDEETYSAYIRKRLKRCHVINFGTDGYGTVQMLLQYRQAIKDRRKPNLVIVGHLPEHVERDNLFPIHRKLMAPLTGPQFKRFPFAKLGPNNSLEIAWLTELYRPLPGATYSSFINLLDQVLATRNLNEGMPVTLRVFEEFARDTKRDGITLVIAPLQEISPKTKEGLLSMGVPVIPASIDYEDLGNVVSKTDNHPSAVGHRLIADRLIEGLSKENLLSSSNLQ